VVWGWVTGGGWAGTPWLWARGMGALPRAEWELARGPWLTVDLLGLVTACPRHSGGATHPLLVCFPFCGAGNT